jgi:hypothetical protein
MHTTEAGVVVIGHAGRRQQQALRAETHIDWT